jgi:hypothetical protein
MGLVATQSAETTQVDPLTTTAEHRYYSIDLKAGM